MTFIGKVLIVLLEIKPIVPEMLMLYFALIYILF